MIQNVIALSTLSAVRIIEAIKNTNLLPKAHVLQLFQSSFDIGQDRDVITKETANRASVDAYNESGDAMDGPNPLDLKFDMLGSSDSLWNRRVMEILREKFRDLDDEENWELPPRSNLYIDEIILDRFNRIRSIWRAGQLRVKENGELETETEWEERVGNEQLEDVKKGRHLTRRKNVSVEIRVGRDANKSAEI